MMEPACVRLLRRRSGWERQIAERGLRARLSDGAASVDEGGRSGKFACGKWRFVLCRLATGVSAIHSASLCLTMEATICVGR